MNRQNLNGHTSFINYQNLCEIIDFRNINLPDVIAYRFLEGGIHAETLTSRELYLEVNKLANLIGEYIKPKDRVILAARPGLEYIIGFFACLRAGAIAVPVFPPANTQMASRLLHIINDAKPSLVLCDKNTTASLKKGGIANRFLPNKFKKMAGLNETFANLFDLLRKAHIPIISTEQRKKYPAELTTSHQIEPQDIAFLQYTSGSTGHPKGVILTHSNLLDNVEIIKNAVNHTEKSHVFSWLPPYHDLGLIGCIIEPLYANITATHMSPIDFITTPSLWVINISKYRCTTMAAPNFAFDLCARKTPDSIVNELDLSCLDVVVNGAEPISMKTMELFYDKFKSTGLTKNTFHPCYGLAEATLMVASKSYLSEARVLNVNPQSLGKNKIELISDTTAGTYLVSSGLPRTNVKIVHPETHNLCQQNEVGEIWVNGGSIGQGYYNNEAETNKTFKNQLNDSQDKQYYLKTGDLGFIHEGELFICGRLKDLIIINGQNYYPHDFEFEVMSASPHIQKGCVIAFSEKATATEQLVLVADLKAGTKPEVYPEIIAAIQKAISSAFYLSAHAIYLTPPKTIPKTTSGKLQRKQCAELIQNNKMKYLYCYQSTSSNEVTEENWITNVLNEHPDNRKNLLINKIKELIAEVMNIPDIAAIDAKTSLFELGIDSLNAIHLGDKLQDKLSINITMSEVYSNHRIDQLVNYLLKKIELAPTEAETTKNANALFDKDKEFECSSLQEAILKHYSINTELSKYNLFSSVLFGREVKREDILRKVIHFIDENDTLRIKFIKKNNEFKFIYTTKPDYDSYIHWIKVNAINPGSELRRNEVLKKIDLMNDLLFRIVILEYETGEHEVLYIANHIISDINSMIMAQLELKNPYNDKKESYTQALFNDEQRINYSEELIKKINSLWTQKLDGLDYLKLHNKNIKGSELFTTKKIELCTKDVMTTLTSNYHTTGFIVCMALMCLVLNALSTNEKIQLLIPFNKRKKCLANQAQGLFVNNLLICPLIDWNLNFKNLCQSIQQEFIDSQVNYYPIEKLVTESITNNNFNLPVVMGYMGDYSSSDIQLNNIGSTNMGLDLMIYYTIDKESKWNMFINYVDGMFTSEIISQIGSCFNKMLNRVLTSPQVLNRDLYPFFDSNQLLHDYSKSLQEKSIEIKTNIENDLISDALRLFIDNDEKISLKIRKTRNNNLLFIPGNIGGNQLKISIININDLIRNNQDDKERILLHIKSNIERLSSYDRSHFILGFIGSNELINSDIMINLKKEINKSNHDKVIFFQTTEIGNEYELDLIKLIKNMLPEIMIEVERLNGNVLVPI